MSAENTRTSPTNTSEIDASSSTVRQVEVKSIHPPESEPPESEPPESEPPESEPPKTGVDNSGDHSEGVLCGECSLEQRVEALLLSSDRPLSEERLREMLGLNGKEFRQEVRRAVETLNRDYEKTGRTFRIERLAGGWRMLTLSVYGPLLARLHAIRQSAKLSQSALEALAIIAYRQPLMRAEIEAIRGVGCGEVLRGLMERRLVKITGRAEEIGRPMLYGTTREFLRIFGLAGLDDLPVVEGLERKGSTPPRIPRVASSTTPVDPDQAAQSGSE